MNVTLRTPMTVEAFLAWEERQDARYEFDGVRPIAMNGGNLNHDRITFRLHKALDARRAGKSCEAFGPNVKVQVVGRVRYPDGVVSCSSQRGKDTVIVDPVVMFEVLSAGSARIDRIDKAREYTATPSVRRYVMLEQDGIAATVLERAGSVWVSSTPVDGDVLRMPEIGIELPLAEIYAGIVFEDAPDTAG